MNYTNEQLLQAVADWSQDTIRRIEKFEADDQGLAKVDKKMLLEIFKTAHSMVTTKSY